MNFLPAVLQRGDQAQLERAPQESVGYDGYDDGIFTGLHRFLACTAALNPYVWRLCDSGSRTCRARLRV